MIFMSDLKYCYTARIIEKNAFLYFDIVIVITEDVSVYIVWIDYCSISDLVVLTIVKHYIRYSFK